MDNFIMNAQVEEQEEYLNYIEYIENQRGLRREMPIVDDAKGDIWDAEIY